MKVVKLVILLQKGSLVWWSDFCGGGPCWHRWGDERTVYVLKFLEYVTLHSSHLGIHPWLVNSSQDLLWPLFPFINSVSDSAGGSLHSRLVACWWGILYRVMWRLLFRFQPSQERRPLLLSFREEPKQWSNKPTSLKSFCKNNWYKHIFLLVMGWLDSQF